MKKKVVLGLILALFFGSFFVYAKRRGPSFKVAYVDLRQVFKEYKETQKLQEILQKKQDEIKFKLQEKQDEITKWRNTWVNNKKLSKKDRQAKEQELYKKLTEFQDYRNYLLRNYEEYRMKMSKKVEDSIIEATKKIATQKGYTLVLDRTIVIYGGDDLTKDVIDLLNKKYVNIIK